MEIAEEETDKIKPDVADRTLMLFLFIILVFRKLSILGSTIFIYGLLKIYGKLMHNSQTKSISWCVISKMRTVFNVSKYTIQNNELHFPLVFALI